LRFRLADSLRDKRSGKQFEIHTLGRLGILARDQQTVAFDALGKGIQVFLGLNTKGAKPFVDSS
jgi:hypothetical protein